MANVFIGALKTLSRDRGLFVWALAFPLILATMFMLMFSGIDNMQSFEAVPVAYVDDGNWRDSAFSEVIEQLGEGDEPLLAPTPYVSEEEARAALASDTVVGVLSVNADGDPHVMVAPVSGVGGAGSSDVDRTILDVVVNTYARNVDLVTRLAAENPMAFANPDAVEEAFSAGTLTERVSLTRSTPSETVRFYYAMFGMAALFGAQVGMTAVCRTQPNLSPLGARRAIGAMSRGKTMLATLAASWLVAFVCLLVAFAYVRLVVGVDFGGRDGLCIAGLAAASFFATSFGTLLGALPKVNLSGKSGILTGATCLLSLFAGLYGEPCMELADAVAKASPVLASLNPARVITDMFYSLYYYDALDPFLVKVGTLLLMAAVFFAVASVFIRRQRYASL